MIRRLQAGQSCAGAVYGVMCRLLPWLPCAVVAVAGALQVRGIDAAQMIDHPGFLASGAIWLLLPVVIGALFVIYNRRKVIHVLLGFFLLGNFAGWSLACLILSDGKGYDKPLAWFFWPMLDYLVLTAIFFLWVAINAWEMIREG